MTGQVREVERATAFILRYVTDLMTALESSELQSLAVRTTDSLRIVSELYCVTRADEALRFSESVESLEPLLELRLPLRPLRWLSEEAPRREERLPSLSSSPGLNHRMDRALRRSLIEQRLCSGAKTVSKN